MEGGGEGGMEGWMYGRREGATEGGRERRSCQNLLYVRSHTRSRVVKLRSLARCVHLGLGALAHLPLEGRKGGEQPRGILPAALDEESLRRASGKMLQ